MSSPSSTSSPRPTASATTAVRAPNCKGEFLLVDKANLLLTPVRSADGRPRRGSTRAGANYDGSKAGVFTERPGTLTNDFFTTITDMGCHLVEQRTRRRSSSGTVGGKEEVAPHRVDLVFGSNAELRALSEVYGADDAAGKSSSMTSSPPG